MNPVYSLAQLVICSALVTGLVGQLLAAVVGITYFVQWATGL